MDPQTGKLPPAVGRFPGSNAALRLMKLWDARRPFPRIIGILGPGQRASPTFHSHHQQSRPALRGCAPLGAKIRQPNELDRPVSTTPSRGTSQETTSSRLPDLNSTPSPRIRLPHVAKFAPVPPAPPALIPKSPSHQATKRPHRRGRPPHTEPT